MNIKNPVARPLLCGILALSLTAGPALGLAQDYRSGPMVEDKGANMLLDTLVVRPLMLATTIVGAGLWVVSLPFTIPGGSVNDAGREFIYKTGEYTFARPLGNWHQCGVDHHPC